MRHLLKLQKSLLASLLVSVMLFSGVAFAEGMMQKNTAQTTVASAKVRVPVLFVLSAESGSIAKDDNYYTLTLNQIDPHILWFTERPHRRAGFLGLTSFLADWAKQFAIDPPNAAMVYVSMESGAVGKNQPMAMRFSRPVYSHGQLIFKLNKLKGIPEPTVGSFDGVKLFFDTGWFDVSPVARQDLVNGYYNS